MLQKQFPEKLLFMPMKSSVNFIFSSARMVNYMIDLINKNSGPNSLQKKQFAADKELVDTNIDIV